MSDGFLLEPALTRLCHGWVDETRPSSMWGDQPNIISYTILVWANIYCMENQYLTARSKRGRMKLKLAMTSASFHRPDVAVRQWAMAQALWSPCASTRIPSMRWQTGLTPKDWPRGLMRSALLLTSGSVGTLPDLAPSARKHYRRDNLTDDVVVYAAKHVQCSWPLDDVDDPRRWMMIGIDSAGRLLEMVTLIYDDGYELLIHAMKARPQYINHLII